MKVLDALHAHVGRFASGEELSKKMKVSRSAVWKEIQSLRKLGYKIDGQSRLGYQLTGLPDKMFADEITRDLNTRFIGQRVFAYETLESTNKSAYQLGEEGLGEGTCVIAEHQSKGRGRLGRSWSSPKGKGLLFSLLLRPILLPSQISMLTLTTSIAIAKTIRTITGKQPGIKWPNDVFHQNKKICGILTEMNAEADKVNFVVVGIGINVNTNASALPKNATSLKEMLGEPASRLDFLKEFFCQFEEDYEKLKRGKTAQLVKEWEGFSITTGKKVTAQLLNHTIEGEALGIDEDGALWIRTDNGLQEKLLSGDITHLR